MKIPNNIEYMEVYYDGHCGMCCTFHEWVNEQERAFQVRFIAYQDPLAEELFPEIHTLEPDREMIVRTQDGQLYFGAEGWVLCLFCCQKYQGVARRMAGPALLPLAKKACHALAARRHKVSKIFFRKKDREVAEELHQMEPEECTDNCANTPDGLI